MELDFKYVTPEKVDAFQGKSWNLKIVDFCMGHGKRLCEMEKSLTGLVCNFKVKLTDIKEYIKVDNIGFTLDNWN